MNAIVIGYGVIGKVHCRILSELGVRFSVCDCDENALNEARKVYPDIELYTDWRRSIDSEKPSVVHICTPHWLHADMSIYALEHGANVLCEKPICIKEEDIARIQVAVAASGKQFGACHQNRYNGSFRFAKSLLSNKKVTAAYATVVWNRSENYYRSGDWRGKWSTEGGGVLINQALHTLDLLECLIGEPEHIDSHIDNFHLKDAIEVEDTACIRWEQNGASACFYATTASGFDFPIKIFVKADDGIYTVSQDTVMKDDEIIFTAGKGGAYGKVCYGNGHGALISDFYDCVTNNRKFEIDVNEASKVIRLILAAYKDSRHD